MQILIAPNAFKNSLDAPDAAGFIREGLRQSKLLFTATCFPIGDGGDGTGSLIVQNRGGSIINVQVSDPLFRKIPSGYGLIDNGTTAVIEMSDASGLKRLRKEEYDPLHTTSFGTGELIKHALDLEVKQVILCIGGSATVDGGTGILQALGVRFMDADRNDLSDLPEKLIGLATIDLSGLDQRVFSVNITVLCDVDNFLLGESGAAHVFGPQKGASAKDIVKLETALSNYSKVAYTLTGIDMATIRHGGAAGGVAAGLATFLNARLVNGTDYFLDATGFDDALQKAAVVITGEGSIDDQTLQGKGPFGVAKRAKEKGIPVIGVAGKVPLMPSEALLDYFNVLLAIGNGPVDIDVAMKETSENLVRTGQAIGNMLSFSSALRDLNTG